MWWCIGAAVVVMCAWIYALMDAARRRDEMAKRMRSEHHD